MKDFLMQSVRGVKRRRALHSESAIGGVTAATTAAAVHPLRTSRDLPMPASPDMQHSLPRRPPLRRSEPVDQQRHFVLAPDANGVSRPARASKRLSTERSASTCQHLAPARRCPFSSCGPRSSRMKAPPMQLAGQPADHDLVWPRQRLQARGQVLGVSPAIAPACRRPAPSMSPTTTVPEAIPTCAREATAP